MNTRSKNELKEIKLLGNQNTTYPTDYDPSILEYFENKHPYNDYVVTLDAYEFSSLCVTGDTMIDVACDETKYPTGIPISDLVGTEGYVFGVDEHSLRPVCRKYSDVRCTRKDAPVVKIVMEAIKGASSAGTFHKEITTVKCTPDHPVLVKRGFHDSEWVPASELIPGMRLIADQRCGDTIRSTSRHRLIAENLYQDVLDVHHKDGNHFNNSPGNLINKLKSTHLSDHRLEDYGYEDRLDIETLLQLYNSGENINSIAKMYGCDNSTVESRIGHLIDKRQQSESLKLRNIRLNEERDAEICELYTKGYLISEIGEYIGLHPTKVSEILKQNNVTIRESNFARYNRQKLDLPSLNHKVLAVVDAGTEDVYNMEVEDIHNFFGNGVILHNCPKTGQPDFAKVVISYIPNIKMVESKSLKLYLFSFRNHGDFHEDCMNIIMKDLIRLMDPKYIEVRGIFSPRGGISIFPFCNWANPKSEYEKFANQRKLEILRDSSNRKIKYDV